MVSSKPLITEDVALDQILSAFVEDGDELETIEQFLNRIGNDEVVLMLHMAIHKYFGG